MTDVTIIGSTGSVGRSTLSVADHLGGQVRVHGLAAKSSMRTLAEQTARHHPRIVALADASLAGEFVAECKALGVELPEVWTGAEGVIQLAGDPGAAVVVSAAVGAAGLEPTYAALAAGKTVALANKEAMVVAGELLRRTALAAGGRILPVDSEHSAIDQCLRAGRPAEVRRLILTASGGPFWKYPAARFPSITPAAALEHPTWRMGRRITIDSATLMNKGFEVIEAHWLFDVSPSAIEVVVHPQSIVHSMVEYVDGSIVAQLGAIDMRGPIQYALTYPERLASPAGRLDLASLPPLEFHAPDHERFPALLLAYRALEMGGTAPAVLNAADEIAVESFLEGVIRFTDVSRIVAAVLDAHDPAPADGLPAILDADRWARERARKEARGRASQAIP